MQIWTNLWQRQSLIHQLVQILTGLYKQYIRMQENDAIGIILITQLILQAHIFL